MAEHDSETRQTYRLLRLLPIVALIFAAVLVIWLLMAPTSTTVQDAGKPPPLSDRNTGTAGQGVPNPPAGQENQADQTTGQGQGGAGSDSTRTTPGPTNPTEGAR